MLFSVLFATRRITEKHAISPNMNVNAPGTTSFTYARMLNMTNIKPLSTPNFFFPCNCTLNTQILIPSTNQIGGFCDTLFLHPTAQYWYLYALFFIFLVTPTFSTVKMTAVGLAVAIAAKAYILTGGYRNICCIDCSYK